MYISIVTSMLKCNCNELCFFYKKPSIIEIDNKKYVQTHNFNKCNRLPNENSKKKPCDFISKILIEEKLIEDKIKIHNLEVVNYKSTNTSTNKILTYKHVRNKINDIFQYYDVKSSNYFGNLNYNLKLIGYHPHDPKIESLIELKTRLSKKPINITKIYMNKESYFSRTIGEFDYDYDNEEQIFKGIKRGDNQLDWTKNEIVQDILKRKTPINKKLTKSNKSNKFVKARKCKVTSIEDLINSEEEDKIEENEEKENDHKKEDEDEEEEDDEDEDKNCENNNENEFDIEELSDDNNDYDDNNYDDFSD